MLPDSGWAAARCSLHSEQEHSDFFPLEPDAGAQADVGVGVGVRVAPAAGREGIPVADPPAPHGQPRGPCALSIGGNFSRSPLRPKSALRVRWAHS